MKFALAVLALAFGAFAQTPGPDVQQYIRVADKNFALTHMRVMVGTGMAAARTKPSSSQAARSNRLVRPPSRKCGAGFRAGTLDAQVGNRHSFWLELRDAKTWNIIASHLVPETDVAMTMELAVFSGYPDLRIRARK